MGRYFSLTTKARLGPAALLSPLWLQGRIKARKTFLSARLLVVGGPGSACPLCVHSRRDSLVWGWLHRLGKDVFGRSGCHAHLQPHPGPKIVASRSHLSAQTVCPGLYTPPQDINCSHAHYLTCRHNPQIPDIDSNDLVKAPPLVHTLACTSAHAHTYTQPFRA